MTRAFFAQLALLCLIVGTGGLVPVDAASPVSLSQWRPDYTERCLPNNLETETATTAVLRELLALLASEPTLGAPLLEQAQTLGVTICLDDRADGTFGYYDYRYNLIAVQAELDLYEQGVILLHELRHADLVARGFRPSLRVSMREAARLTLASEADAQAVTALFAWRMAQRGTPELWAALGAFEHYADIAEAFACSYAATRSEALATRAAFIAWYASDWRRRTYYRNSCMTYLDRLDETKLVPGEERLPEGFFADLCLLPDGERYLCCTDDPCLDPWSPITP